MGVQESDLLAHLSLPPGFRFYPTDEELLVQYLCRKVADQPFPLQIIGDIDLYKFDPWVLPSKAMFGEKEWYFFSPRDRKYPNGSRPNRVAGSGYWKATGTDKIITTEGRKVGIKKALVFYVGKAPKGTKTNWIMHEYRLLDSTRKSRSSKLDDWVLCRIYKKNSGSQKITPTTISSREHSTNGSFSSPSSSYQTDHLDDVMHSLSELDDRYFALPRVNSMKKMPQDDRANVNNQLMGSTSFDWATLAGLNSLPEPGPVQQNQQGFFGYNNNDVANYESSISPILNANQAGSVEQEVQSGLRTQRVSNPGPAGYFPPNQDDLAQNFSTSIEPYGLRFPIQPGSGYGFKQ